MRSLIQRDTCNGERLQIKHYTQTYPYLFSDLGQLRYVSGDHKLAMVSTDAKIVQIRTFEYWSKTKAVVLAPLTQEDLIMLKEDSPINFLQLLSLSEGFQNLSITIFKYGYNRCVYSLWETNEWLILGDFNTFILPQLPKWITK